MRGERGSGSKSRRHPFPSGSRPHSVQGEFDPAYARFGFASRHIPTHPGAGVLGTRRLDHRHDASLQGLGQFGPCFDHGGQVGVGFTGVVRQMIGNGRGLDASDYQASPWGIRAAIS